jgi:hypothetical protein
MPDLSDEAEQCIYLWDEYDRYRTTIAGEPEPFKVRLSRAYLELAAARLSARPNLSAELAAAADRQRRLYAGATIADVYGDSDDPDHWCDVDQRMLSRAWVTARPGDDAEVVEAAERLRKHKAAIVAGDPTKSPYWEGHGWISWAPGEVADLRILANTILTQPRHP